MVSPAPLGCKVGQLIVRGRGLAYTKLIENLQRSWNIVPKSKSCRQLVEQRCHPNLTQSWFDWDSSGAFSGHRPDDPVGQMRYG
jgi:hypothetical protein